MPRAIILTDGKAGHENQSRAFARALGCEAELVPVAFKSRFHKSLSYLLDRLGIRTLGLFKGEKFAVCSLQFAAADAPISPSARKGRGTVPQLQTANCKLQAPVILATGSGTFYAAKALAKRLGAKCGVVLYPRGYDLASFDCILAPAFDNPPPRPNVVTVPVNLVASDEAFYEKGVAAFRERCAPTGRPAVAVIVGGPNKCSTMTADWMRRELARVFAETPGCDHWVTTSRRTPPDVEAAVDSFPFDYKLLYSRDHFNPIPAFVKLAARLYVTAESTGMLSEACSFGAAEVHALDNLHPGPHKFRRFLESLAAAGYVGGSRKADLSGAFASARRLLGL